MKINIIVAFCKNFGIGHQDQIPWHISEDLQYFRELTNHSIVIMGRKTYFSIPENKRPLIDRYNIVSTNDPNKYQSYEANNVVFINFKDVYKYLTNITYPYKNIFVIGGESIYKKMLFFDFPIDKLFITYIDKDYKCDKFFPMFALEDFKLIRHSDNKVCEQEHCNYRFLEYQHIPRKHDEYQYIDLINDIFRNGNSRDDRTKTGTISVFGRQIRFDINGTIPLLTTKFVPFKMIVKELLWFLNGQTDNKILQDQNVHIWDGNSTREFLDQRGLKEYKSGDIGPMYGFQWRHFGAEYKGCNHDYTGHGIDQLDNVIDLLINDPFSRRIAMTTYNVCDLEKGVLHPCHGIYIQFYVEVCQGVKYLSCHMTQRSVDCGLGLPFNIASYAVLTHIIAQKVDMRPKELIISTGDTHIYNNHKDALLEQIQRTPYPFPMLNIKDIKNKPWNDISVDDFELVGYFSHPSIKLIMSV